MVDGHLRTCLSRDDTPSLRDLVRAGADDAAIEAALREMVWAKVAGHEAHLDGDAFRAFEGVMTAIGG
jgi:cyclic pyranopterin phosphate synthase